MQSGLFQNPTLWSGIMHQEIVFPQVNQFLTTYNSELLILNL